MPGGNLYTVTNGGTPKRAFLGSSGNSAVTADGPFAVGDELVVWQELCDDESPTSEPTYAVAAPTFMPPIQIDPEDVFEQQELFAFTSIVAGSTLNIEEANTGPVGSIFSWPSTRYRNWDFATAFGGPFLNSHQLLVKQILCTDSQVTDITTTKTCEELDPPLVAPLISGQDFVIVSNAVPGASIRIYDANGEEIGDGGAPIILLLRPLEAGETITVVQELDVECVGENGMSYIVNEGDGQMIGGQ